MKTGEALRLTDGDGKLADAVIINDHKKKTEVLIKDFSIVPQPSPRNVIAISLLKNNTRLEWFLEKAAELGISKIVPLLCSRTEKQHFRYDRMKSILVSAMLQSQQPWLTELSEPINFKEFIAKETSERDSTEKDAIEKEAIEKEATEKEATEKDATEKEATEKEAIQKKATEKEVTEKQPSEKNTSEKITSARKTAESVQRFIAHCEDTRKEQLSSPKYQNIKPKLVLIGPEGDFTPEEIKLATDNGYHPVELGKTRLRTETAGVVAATIIQIIH